MNLMLYMSPIAVVVLLPAAVIMEPNVWEVTVSLTVKHRFMWLLLLTNSTMAYAANLCNFLVTKHTSALTLQVCSSFSLHYYYYYSSFRNVLNLINVEQVLGNAKGAVAVVISILLFRNPVTFVGIAGYTMTVMGVVAYGEAKRRYK